MKQLEQPAGYGSGPDHRPLARTIRAGEQRHLRRVNTMEGTRIVKIESGRLDGVRPRKAGSNARRGDHGIAVPIPIVRLTTSDGATGFGRGRATREQAEALVGQNLSEAFVAATGAADAWLPAEYPLWDLAAKRSGRPVFRLAAQIAGRALPSGP